LPSVLGAVRMQMDDVISHNLGIGLVGSAFVINYMFKQSALDQFDVYIMDNMKTAISITQTKSIELEHKEERGLSKH
jgi:hypothetical protein